MCHVTVCYQYSIVCLNRTPPDSSIDQKPICFQYVKVGHTFDMEYITLRLDGANEVEQWYVRHSYFYCLIT